MLSLFLLLLLRSIYMSHSSRADHYFSLVTLEAVRSINAKCGITEALETAYGRLDRRSCTQSEWEVVQYIRQRSGSPPTRLLSDLGVGMLRAITTHVSRPPALQPLGTQGFWDGTHPRRTEACVRRRRPPTHRG